MTIGELSDMLIIVNQQKSTNSSNYKRIIKLLNLEATTHNIEQIAKTAQLSIKKRKFND